MKKSIITVRVRCFLSFLVFFLLLLVPSVTAENETEVGETLPEEYIDFLESIPEELRPLLPDGIFSTDASDLGDAIQEMSDFSFLLQTVVSFLGAHLKDALHLLASLAGMLLLCAVSRTAQTALRRETLARAFSFCTNAILLLFLLKNGYQTVLQVHDYFSTLNQITQVSIPLMGVLYAMGGNISVAVASSSGLSVFMTIMENFVGKTIVPFFGICMAFAMMGALDPALRTGTLLNTVKKNYTTVLTFLMMLLLAMLSSQSILGAKSDTLAMKSAKFAAGSIIPVVGGSVSELLKSVSAGVGYLRGTVGICALLLLLLLLLPPLIELFLLRFTWQFSASIADLLGCDGEKRLLEEISSLYGYLIAALCICSSVLFLSFVLLTHCASAIS